MAFVIKYQVYEIRYIESDSITQVPSAYYLKQPERYMTNEENERGFGRYGRIALENRFNVKKDAEEFIILQLSDQTHRTEYTILEVYCKE